MKKRSLILILLMSLASINADARGPFGRRQFSSRPSTPPSQRSTPAPPLRGVLLSPEKMDQLYGPSILIRQKAQTSSRDMRFVVQPED